MRIVSGTYKGQKLNTLQGQDVRPTTDRVKESLFNILQFRVEGRMFLDLFAGSGQVGIEALSRGAKGAVFVDASRKATDVVKENLAKLGAQDKATVYTGGYDSFLKGNSLFFDAAFLDPPYKTDILLPALYEVEAAMTKTGIIICEHGIDESLPERLEDFVLCKNYRYGKIMLSAYEHCSVTD